MSDKEPRLASACFKSDPQLTNNLSCADAVRAAVRVDNCSTPVDFTPDLLGYDVRTTLA